MVSSIKNRLVSQLKAAVAASNKKINTISELDASNEETGGEATLSYVGNVNGSVLNNNIQNFAITS